MSPIRRAAPKARGRWVDGRFDAAPSPVEMLECRAPADPDEVIAIAPLGAGDVDDAVRAARAAAGPWARLSIAARLNGLDAARRAFAARQSELMVILGRESSRPPWECAREVSGLVARLAHTIQVAAELLAPRVTDASGSTTSLPLGVVAVIGPAMLPLGTAHTHVVAALAAGNTVVLKPSPLAAASALVYADAWQAAGLPRGVLNIVLGGERVGALLAAHAGVDAAVVIGRTETCTGARATRLVAHPGAQNTAVVLADADRELAAYELVTSAFLSAGQRCTAIGYVAVERRFCDALLEVIVPLARSLRVGPPAARTFMGPMLSEARRTRYLAALAEAHADDEALLRAQPLDRPGWFMSPSVHVARGPRAGHRVELFGPDLTVCPVDDLDEALALVGPAPCAALFTRDAARWRHFAREARAGTLFHNRGTCAPSGRLPFGGADPIGWGARGGAEAILALRRVVSLQTGDAEPAELFPGTLDEDAPAAEALPS